MSLHRLPIGTTTCLVHRDLLRWRKFDLGTSEGGLCNWREGVVRPAVQHGGKKIRAPDQRIRANSKQLTVLTVHRNSHLKTWLQIPNFNLTIDFEDSKDCPPANTQKPDADAPESAKASPAATDSLPRESTPECAKRR